MKVVVLVAVEINEEKVAFANRYRSAADALTPEGIVKTGVQRGLWSGSKTVEGVIIKPVSAVPGSVSAVPGAKQEEVAELPSVYDLTHQTDYAKYNIAVREAWRK